MVRLQIIEIILCIGAAQGVLLSAVLFSRWRRNHPANVILAALLAIFSLLIFFHTSGEMQGYPADKNAHVHSLESVFALFWPLLYFYTRASTEKGFSFRVRDLLHGIPFGMCLALSAAVPAADEREEVLHIVNIALPLLFIIQIVVYYYCTIRILDAHGKNLKRYYSSPGRSTLRWLYFLLSGQAIIWPFSMIVELSGGDSHSWNYVWLLISAFIYAMGYFALRQPEVFAGIALEEMVPADESRRKYERSALTADDAKKHAGRLDDLMRSEKPYLSNELSLPDLAKRLGLSTHHLSQVLNETLGCSFFDYVNGCRVGEAKRHLANPEKRHYSIAAIGFEAGFNSLSAFNSVFKKVTGQTPSQYRAGPHRLSP